MSNLPELKLLPTAEEIEALKSERDALAAQVEQLRTGFNQAIELLVTALHEPQQITESEIHDLRTLEKSTPVHCLAAHDAKVEQDVILSFIDWVIDNNMSNALDAAAHKFMQLRQPAKGGE